MKAYINSILYPVKTLGPGERVGVWFQGCSIKCRGCMSKHTWEKKDIYLRDLDSILNEILSHKSGKITISGGEPFQQPEALKYLLERLNEKNIEDIIVYSGMENKKIFKNYKWIKDLCGVLITEPFLENYPSDKIYKGSENQKAFVFKNKSYYKKWLNKKKDKKLQIIGNSIVGIL